MQLSSIHCFFDTACMVVVVVTGSDRASLMQQAWLMKAVAIELRVTAINRQRSHTERLMALLLDDSSHLQSTAGNFTTNGVCCIPSSVLTLLVGQQEGHPACKKLGVGLLVVALWLELCTSYSSNCHPLPSSLAPIKPANPSSPGKWHYNWERDRDRKTDTEVVWERCVLFLAWTSVVVLDKCICLQRYSRIILQVLVLILILGYQVFVLVLILRPLLPILIFALGYRV